MCTHHFFFQLEVVKHTHDTESRTGKLSYQSTDLSYHGKSNTIFSSYEVTGRLIHEHLEFSQVLLYSLVDLENLFLVEENF